ncbi:phosphatase PAP2 family protein [Mucilaginibacter terrigena]|uniref:Phosphatase PAP2 family protein n=1 Tax=Mucilaginibacter terrigena TaxID=2492395 RepID=A0A4Q5LPT7_9SPHI|nr:phosphatase PAP2 family protein [Mucilaginibacter terrigena]RYU91431.1 phosphatase PAP2 family protein [Mucilaginibacter terrigena]
MKFISNKYFLAFFAAIQLFTAGPFATRSFGQSQIQQFDDRVMLNLAANRTPAQTDVMMFLSRTYKYGDIGVPAALLVGGIVTNDKQMRQNSLYVASSTALSYGVMLLLKHLVKRPRPFVQNINIVPVYRAGSTSFPSGHATSTFSTAMALSNAYPKWYVIAPSFLWAGATSYSRMYLGVHYPTDVAAGMALGTGTALLLQPIKRW